MSVRVVFMGTPEFAVPSMTALLSPSAREKGFELAAVVTQPDRPRGRGRKLRASPVKVAAESAGIRVLQPETLKSAEAVSELVALQPELVVVAAFGQILRSDVLNLPSYGCINVHASLLPRWRGAAPVAAAILAGDQETGVTLMQMDEGLDTGPLIAQRAAPITASHTTGTLTAELAKLGASLLLETLPAWVAGDIKPAPQRDDLATLAPRLAKKEGAIDWRQPAAEIERQVRAFDPWPGAYTEGPRGRFKVLTVEPAPEMAELSPGAPGTVFAHQRDVYVNTGQGLIRLVMVQPAGKGPMTAEAMLNGQPELVGARLEIDQT